MNASRGAVVLILLAAGGWAAAGPEVAPAPRLAMPEFVSKEWKFAAKFSGKPKEQSQAGPVGTTMTMFGVESKDGMYGIAVADMPIPTCRKAGR